MMLHNDEILFEQTILRTSNYFDIRPEIIEKDYYVTIFLKEIVRQMPEIVFKGGTSLSKCYHIIKRFSEDIDLNLLSASKPSESKRKQLKKSIVDTTNHFSFVLENPDDVRSRREYNKYIIKYPTTISADYLKEKLIVETSIFQRTYPTKVMQVSSLVYSYLSDRKYNSVINEYDLSPFDINVQTAERTLIDKVYAIADYFLSDNIREHSRHIYDIHKLLSIVEINNELRDLGKEVAAERKLDNRCFSVQNGIKINDVLEIIIKEAIYKNDYETITQNLLFEKVSYEDAIQGLEKILESNLFG